MYWRRDFTHLFDLLPHSAEPSNYSINFAPDIGLGWFRHELDEKSRIKWDSDQGRENESSIRWLCLSGHLHGIYNGNWKDFFLFSKDFSKTFGGIGTKASMCTLVHQLSCLFSLPILANQSALCFCFGWVFFLWFWESLQERTITLF